MLYDFEGSPVGYLHPGISAGANQTEANMARAKYYSPRLDRSLISSLYHAAKVQQIPMTALASRLVAEGLSRINDGGETCIVAEEPPVCDPTPAE